MIDLIIFDLDGTLAKIYTLNLLPGVAAFFRQVYQGSCARRPKLAVATNQGGVGIRYGLEHGYSGRPGSYPSEAEIEERLQGLLALVGGGEIQPTDLPVYVSYRYQNRKGQWTPVPPEKAQDPRWSSEWRKPSPGMLLQAMQDAGVGPVQTLFVGDSPDDENAARAAACHFTWAAEFFARDWSTCQSIEEIGV